jgi:hypothetical protein
MKYCLVKTYGELERVDGRPVVESFPCKECGRIVRLGETDLTVRFVTSPPYPDALGVLFGPEWLVSKALRQIIDSVAPSAVKYVAVKTEGGESIDYEQAIVKQGIHAGETSIRGGSFCETCGGSVQLKLEPLFLRRIEDEGPAIAHLTESPAICLMRKDLADAVRSAGLDIDLVATYYDGESLPKPGPTFPGEDWGEL